MYVWGISKHCIVAPFVAMTGKQVIRVEQALIYAVKVFKCNDFKW